MSAEVTSPHQFGEMHRRLKEEGGFTYDPRKKDFVTEGYSVAAHPAAELTVPHAEGGASEAHIEGYTVGSAPVWQQQKAKGRGQETIGGWRSDEGEKDVLDLPKVYPATPTGHMKSRQAQILRNQEASFVSPRRGGGPEPVVHGLGRDGCSSWAAVVAVPRVRQPRCQEPPRCARPGEVPGDRIVGQQADARGGLRQGSEAQGSGSGVSQQLVDAGLADGFVVGTVHDDQLPVGVLGAQMDAIRRAHQCSFAHDALLGASSHQAQLADSDPLQLAVLVPDVAHDTTLANGN